MASSSLEKEANNVQNPFSNFSQDQQTSRTPDQSVRRRHGHSPKSQSKDCSPVAHEHGNDSERRSPSPLEVIWELLYYDQLPDWMQDNEYLLFGHRPPMPSTRRCLLSMFRYHNETINIWTHFIGFVFFLLQSFYVIIMTDHKPFEKAMMSIYNMSVVVCLLISAVYHTLACHSPDVSQLLCKLDHVGISLQIAGSMIPTYYYAFVDASVRFSYISISVLFCCLSIGLILYDRFDCHRRFRTGVLIGFGLSAIVPGVHGFFILERPMVVYYLEFLFQGGLYLFGAVIYSFKLPERLFPGRFDYLFHSHQIFHVLVVFAAAVHLKGICGLIHFREQTMPTMTRHGWPLSFFPF